MNLGLGQIALRGGMQMFAAQGIKFIAQISSVIILARLVSPGDFGLVAFLGSIFVFVNLFSDFGLTFAIVQKPEIREEDLNTLFRLNLLMAIIFSAGIGGVGILATELSGNSTYLWVIGIFAAIFFLKSLMTVPQGLLRRRLRFGLLSLQEAGTSLAGVIVGLAVAAGGHGLLALLLIQFVPILLCFVSSWLMVGWAPGFCASPLSKVSGYFSFGGSLTIIELANTLCKHLDNLLIGKVWGMESLGQYNRAYTLMLAPLNQVMGPAGTVLVPLFSQTLHRAEIFKKWTTGLFVMITLLSAPAAGYLVANHKEIVTIMLGKNWSLTADVFFWLSFSVFSKPLGCLIFWVFLSSGESQKMLHWTLFYSLGTVGTILVGITQGPVFLALAFACSEVLIQLPLALYFVNKLGVVEYKIWLRFYKIGILLMIGSVIFSSYIHEKLKENLFHDWQILLFGFISSLCLGCLLLLGCKKSRTLLNTAVKSLKR